MECKVSHRVNSYATNQIHFSTNSVKIRICSEVANEDFNPTLT